MKVHRCSVCDRMRPCNEESPHICDQCSRGLIDFVNFLKEIMDDRYEFKEEDD